MAMRLQSWYLLSITISYMSLFFSLSTVMDLYLVLKNPFSSSETRIRKCIVASVIAAFTFASMGLVLTNKRNQDLAELNYRVYQLIAIINLVVAVVVMILVVIRFRKQGMNSAIKK